ncbi:MAG: hypothetical protein QM808_06485 [Steroidobacteraceae bacterium]
MPQRPVSAAATINATTTPKASSKRVLIETPRVHVEVEAGWFIAYLNREGRTDYRQNQRLIKRYRAARMQNQGKAAVDGTRDRLRT